MPDKANASKKKPQQLKRDSEKKVTEEMELSEKEVRNTTKRNKYHPKLLSSEEQTKHIKLKQIRIASNKRKAWQPLLKTTRDHLQTMMETVITANLSNSIEKEQIQHYLNDLKKRLLQQCETLKVPPRKLNCLSNVSNLLEMEMAQNRANEEGLALLQEEIDKIVETTESMTENIHSLKDKIQFLTCEVEEEEKKIKQMLEMDTSGVLSLPELSQKSLKAPTLQEEVLTLIPNHSALLKDLDVLHNSAPMKNMSAFIEEAYRKLDAS